MSVPLAGRHAFITGAGRGTGAAIAAALAAGGARVSLLGRNRERLDARARELGAACAGVHQADVTDAPALRAAIAAAARAAGAIDILVNNAGEIDTRPFGEVSGELWDRLIAVNLGAAFTATQAALPAMLAAGWGRVVNIASTAGLSGYPFVAPYCAAKHGLVGMTRALALEVARKGITVNAVCPGYTDTDMFSQAAALVAERTGRSQDEARARLAANCPTGRIVQPEEVAATVAWLCGPDTGSITGQAISISGGEVMP